MRSWCPHCANKTQTHHDRDTGSTCCTDCGQVVSQNIYSDDTTFVKGADGSTHASGRLAQLATECSESHRRTLNKGNVVIGEIAEKYGITGCEHAKKFYEIAVLRGFTRGRRTDQVAAACLYVACREKEKPFLLIEFSSEIGVSVYELGTVYLQLCQLLSIQNQSFIQKPVDPSLYMHRYITELLGKKDIDVLNTALRLAVTMKKDWMQTGRKPGGICAAAIYVSSVLHGYKCKKSDVVAIVHICEDTLKKRLIEFENTKTQSLTLQEFTQKAIEYEKEMRSCKQPSKMPGEAEVVCQHNSGEVQSGFGLCKNCYMNFCGGLDGLEPPAFQRAKTQRLAKECASPISGKHSDNEGAIKSSKLVPDNVVDETESLSEIDDSEINGYLNTEEEIHFKTIIWEFMYKGYMEEQASKKAASKLPPTETQANAALKKKEKAKEKSNAKSPQTAAEAVGQYFKKKRLSSKINYDVLDSIFDDESQESGKHIIYGSTEILTGGEFVNQLALLGQKMGLGSTSAASSAPAH